MKPLTHCPYCQAELIRKTIPEHLNHTKYEHCPKRCVVDYFQYYKNSYDEPEVNYIRYNTPDNKFSIYTYFGPAPSINEPLSHVYANETTKKYGHSMPILVLPLSKYPLDVTDLKSVHEKIKTLSLFV